MLRTTYWKTRLLNVFWSMGTMYSVYCTHITYKSEKMWDKYQKVQKWKTQQEICSYCCDNFKSHFAAQGIPNVWCTVQPPTKKFSHGHNKQENSTLVGPYLLWLDIWLETKFYQWSLWLTDFSPFQLEPVLLHLCHAVLSTGLEKLGTEG